MNQPDICINRRNRNNRDRNFQSSSSHQYSAHQPSAHQQPAHQQSAHQQREDCSNLQLGDLACSFTRTRKNGKPALLASISVQVRAMNQAALPTLLHHAKELNIRLPFLKVSVRTGTGFVLRGLFCGTINSGSMTDFLNRLTQDFQVFLAYAKAHDIPLRQISHNSLTIV